MQGVEVGFVTVSTSDAKIKKNWEKWHNVVFKMADWAETRTGRALGTSQEICVLRFFCVFLIFLVIWTSAVRRVFVAQLRDDWACFSRLYLNLLALLGDHVDARITVTWRINVKKSKMARFDETWLGAWTATRGELHVTSRNLRTP